MYTLQQFITAELCPEVLVNNLSRLDFYRQQAEAEKKRVTRRLLEIAYAGAAGGEREAVIPALQLDVMRMLDVLYGYRFSRQSSLTVADTGDALTCFYRDIEEILHEILIGLEQHFADYLAPELPLPYSYAARVRQQLRLRLRELELALGRLGVDEALAGLVARPVREFLQNPGERLSFGTLAYYRELMSQLYVTGALEAALADDFHLQVHAVLIHLNFNAMEYYLYCVNKLRRLLKGYAHLHDRITFLSWCIKEIRSVPRKNAPVGLMPRNVAIAGQLQAWLEEERSFLRGLREEHSLPAAENHTAAGWRQAGTAAEETLQTSLTVSQFALMLRIHMEEGVVRCSSLQRVLAFLAGLLKGVRPGMMEEESFEAKYYNPSLATITACKHWVTRLLDRLNEHEQRIRTSIDESFT